MKSSPSSCRSRTCKRRLKQENSISLLLRVDSLPMWQNLPARAILQHAIRKEPKILLNLQALYLWFVRTILGLILFPIWLGFPLLRRTQIPSMAGLLRQENCFFKTQILKDCFQLLPIRVMGYRTSPLWCSISRLTLGYSRLVIWSNSRGKGQQQKEP